MYTTKLLNKNIIEDGKYISIGDEYKDPKPSVFRQPKPGEKAPTPFKILIQPPNQENGHFSKLTYTASPFTETNQYINTQPLEKRTKGFGTRDASRRDEFTNSVRSEQFKESIAVENAITNKARSVESREALVEEMNKSSTYRPPTAEEFPYKLTVSGYDIGKTQVTDFDPKVTRDRYYRFATNRDKFVGPYRPSSAEYGNSAWAIQYQPPSHGSKVATSNFFDKSHLKVP